MVLRGHIRRLTIITYPLKYTSSKPATLSYNPTLLQGTLIADITKFSAQCLAVSVVLLQLPPDCIRMRSFFPVVDFWGRVSVAGCAASVLLPLCRVPSAASAGGKNAPDATSFGPSTTYAATLRWVPGHRTYSRFMHCPRL